MSRQEIFSRNQKLKRNQGGRQMEHNTLIRSHTHTQNCCIQCTTSPVSSSFSYTHLTFFPFFFSSSATKELGFTQTIISLNVIFKVLPTWHAANGVMCPAQLNISCATNRLIYYWRSFFYYILVEFPSHVFLFSFFGGFIRQIIYDAREFVLLKNSISSLGCKRY